MSTLWNNKPYDDVAHVLALITCFLQNAMSYYSTGSTLWNNLIMVYDEQKIIGADRIQHVL